MFTVKKTNLNILNVLLVYTFCFLIKHVHQYKQGLTTGINQSNQIYFSKSLILTFNHY